ncbi:MAG TPA: glycosyltransferase family 4 protein [Thermoplasmata archaeon]|nr:glycosyltransferase family 4 protein [Thermoplasmata archaeon]
MGPRVCYALVSASYGVGQFTEILGVLRSAPAGSSASLVTRRIDPRAAEELGRIPVCPVRGYWSSPLSGQLRAFLRRSELVFVKSGLPFLLASSRAERPSVYVLHQPDPPGLFTGWARLNREFAALAERPSILRRATALVSVAPWVREWYLRTYGIDSEVIPDSFDFAEVPAASETGTEHPGPRLLSVGDWDGERGRKRTHELVESMPRLRRALPEATLTLAGLSPGPRAELSRRAAGLRLDGSVRVLGKLPRTEVDQLYAGADVYLTASICEGFYRPLIESFHAGCPGVVRDPSGLVDPVCHGAAHHLRASGAGALYDGTPQGLAEAVESVYRDRRSLAGPARAYSAAFERSRITPRYARLFERVVGR